MATSRTPGFLGLTATGGLYDQGFKGENIIIGVIDSGIIEVLYVFGWVGSLLYLGGVALALLAVRSAAATRADPFVAAAGAIAVGCFVQIVFFNPFGGTVGMLFWSFVGLALAGQRYRAKAARMAA